jgi:HK97 family phage major capsid protein
MAMKPYVSRSFEIDASGAFKRTFNFDNPRAQDVLSLRRAAGSIGEFMQGLNDAITAEGRPLTADERVALAHATNFQRDVKSALARAEELAQAERDWRPGPQRDPDVEAAARARAAAGIRDDVPDLSTNHRRVSGRRFVEMFGEQSLSSDGWSSVNEFLATVHSGLADPRLRMVPGVTFNATAVGASDPLGGFSVPTQFFARWLDESLEDEIVRPRAEIRPMTSKTASAPSFDGANHTSTLYGAFTGQWVPEDGEITDQVPLLQMMTLSAAKLALLTQVSNELLADGISYDEQLSQAIVKALGFYMDEAFLNGTGVGQPEGVINSPATIEVAKETGQAAATILYENIIKIFARLHPASFGNSVWVCNSKTIPQLLKLTQVVGTGGSVVPVLSESGGRFTMLTRPCLFTEKVPTLGTKGDIGLYDFSQYVIGLRQNMALDRSAHIGFTRATTAYRGLIRVDGRSKHRQAITPKNGDTLSPFVVLATRS